MPDQRRSDESRKEVLKGYPCSNSRTWTASLHSSSSSSCPPVFQGGRAELGDRKVAQVERISLRIEDHRAHTDRLIPTNTDPGADRNQGPEVR